MQIMIDLSGQEAFCYLGPLPSTIGTEGLRSLMYYIMFNMVNMVKLKSAKSDYLM